MWIAGPEIENRYRTFVKQVSKNKDLQKRFLQIGMYRGVIGFPNLDQVIGFLAKIKTDEELMAKWNDYMELDRIGNPHIYSFGSIKSSLNLIRYLNSIQLIKKHFGNLDNLNILEVGAGFGGLCFCIKKTWNVASYNIIDFEEVVELIKELGINTNDKILPQSDLVIAEYSITELTEDDLMAYTNQYLLPAKNVFIRNNLNDDKLKTKWIEVLKTKFDIIQLREEPDTVRINSIIIGKERIGDKPVDYPPLTEQLINVIGAAKRIGYAAIKGDRVRRTEEEQLRIQSICKTNQCGAYDEKQERCKVCGCKTGIPLINKTTWATEHCPKKLW